MHAPCSTNWLLLCHCGSCNSPSLPSQTLHVLATLQAALSRAPPPFLLCWGRHLPGKKSKREALMVQNAEISGVLEGTSMGRAKHRLSPQGLRSLQDVAWCLGHLEKPASVLPQGALLRAWVQGTTRHETRPAQWRTQPVCRPGSQSVKGSSKCHPCFSAIQDHVICWPPF